MTLAAGGEGGALVVLQFTLYGDRGGQRRPSFIFGLGLRE